MDIDHYHKYATFLLDFLLLISKLCTKYKQGQNTVQHSIKEESKINIFDSDLFLCTRVL